MNWAIDFLLKHDYLVLFAFAFADQAGLPVPALPILLAAGAVAATGHISLALGIAVAVLASLLADLIWFELGRRRGVSILRLLCRISLEPDSCVRNTREMFARHGVRSLLYAKFVPGLSTAAPPMAGMVRMPLSRFLAFDAAGAVIWAGTICGLGFLFSRELETIAIPALRLGIGLFVLLAGGLAAYIVWKFVERRRFLRDLKIARITPEELLRKLEAAEPPVVLDVRDLVEFDSQDAIVPGAIRATPEDVHQHLGGVPLNREIVLYCA